VSGEVITARYHDMLQTHPNLIPQYICIAQLCPTQMAYWAKNYITILTRAAHWMTY